MQKIIQNVSKLDFSIDELEQMPISQKVMLVNPKYFDVLRPINVHMRKADGSLQTIDKSKALSQWKSLKETYENLKFEVFVVEPVQGLADFVFCANQSFPFVDKKGHVHAVLSNMHDDTRNAEVSHINEFLISHGYKTHQMPSREQGYFFEGMGDVLWLPGVRFMLGGFGFRTNQKVYSALTALTDAPVAIFELKNPKFYHLDTCLSILNSKTALVCKDAFTEEGFALLKKIFSLLIEVPALEADAPGFACNAHCPDGKHVILQAGSPKTESLLKKHNFIPLPLDTSEFIKSGGSVFCMKLMFF